MASHATTHVWKTRETYTKKKKYERMEKSDLLNVLALEQRENGEEDEGEKMKLPACKLRIGIFVFFFFIGYFCGRANVFFSFERNWNRIGTNQTRRTRQSHKRTNEFKNVETKYIDKSLSHEIIIMWWVVEWRWTTLCDSVCELWMAIT